MNHFPWWTGTSGGTSKPVNDQIQWIGLPPIIESLPGDKPILGRPRRIEDLPIPKRDWPNLTLFRPSPPPPKEDMFSRALAIGIPIILGIGVLGLARAMVK